MLKVFCLDCGDVYMMYTFVKTHWRELLKCVNFIIFKLYLYNVDFFAKGGGEGISPKVILVVLYTDFL